MRTLLPSSLLLIAAACSGSTSTDKPTDTAVSTNTAPTAEAGLAVTQSADTAVQLNGGASSDPDGDALSWHWSFDRVPEGSALQTKEKPFSVNNSSDASLPTFTPDRVGTFIVKLVVNDGKVDSTADYVIINISAPDNLPVANAGTDVTGAVGTAVTLDGTGSYDPKGLTLTYAWTIVDKPASSVLTGLTGSDTVAPSLTVRPTVQLLVVTVL